MFNDGLKRISNFLIENLIQPFEFGDFLGKPVSVLSISIVVCKPQYIRTMS